MRKYFVFGVAVLAVFSMVLPSQASAQSIFLGGGGTFPTGDYSEYAKTGWMVEGGIGFGVGDGGWILFAEGIYGSNSHEGASIQGSGDGEDKTNLLGGFGGVEYAFPLGSVRGWVLGRYLQGQFEDGNTAFFGLSAGVSIPLGG